MKDTLFIFGATTLIYVGCAFQSLPMLIIAGVLIGDRVRCHFVRNGGTCT
jgi:hypothetical protein